MKKLLFLVPFIFQIQACNDANATLQDSIVEFEILHESEYNEYASTTNKSSLIIRDLVSYEEELLKRSSANTKAVNFVEETILLIDMGSRNSGGHSISVQLFAEEGDYIRATVVLTFPGNSCNVDGAITNPYQLIKLRTTKDILVTEEIEFSSC